MREIQKNISVGLLSSVLFIAIFFSWSVYFIVFLTLMIVVLVFEGMIENFPFFKKEKPKGKNFRKIYYGQCRFWI